MIITPFKVVEIFPNLGLSGSYIRYSLSEYSVTNPGTWDINQTGSVANTKNFPTFEIKLKENKFEIEESVSNGELQELSMTGNQIMSI